MCNQSAKGGLLKRKGEMQIKRIRYVWEGG